MNSKNKTIQKLISLVIITSIFTPSLLFFSVPQKAEAIADADPVVGFWTGLTAIFTGSSKISEATTTGILLKNVAKEVARQALMAVAKRAMAEITKSTINWINTGFHGAPLFLENPNSFFRDMAKEQLKHFIDVIGYDSLLYPFGKNFSLNLINTAKSQFEKNAAYSLSKVTDDPALLAQFRADFSLGGWNGFLLTTQYPQNNYIGFNMMATNELARRLKGTGSSPAEKVKDTLQQGLGFLSPQKCESNPNWDPKELKKGPEPIPYDPPMEQLNYDEGDYEIIHAYNVQYEKDKAAEAALFYSSAGFGCDEGPVNTTPGSLVSSQIMNAMGSKNRQTELAMAMGNNLSAIFDALINHFMEGGLTALSEKINASPLNPDSWDYYGNTLGAGLGINGNGSWSMGPDEEIVLSAFKEELSGKTIGKCENIPNIITKLDISKNECYAYGDPPIKWTQNQPGEDFMPGVIYNTEREIDLIEKIIKKIDEIWPATKALDYCIPGPNIGWEDRLQKEMERNTTKLQKKTGKKKESKSMNATIALRELRFAVSVFKDFIITQMDGSLPDAVTYIEAVKQINGNYQTITELTAKKQEKKETLARLKSLKFALSIIGGQPEAGSAQEKNLIYLRQSYNALKSSASSSASLTNIQNQLSTYEEKLENLKTLETQCQTERGAVGWETGGGASASNQDGTEFQLFCSWPIEGGYQHGIKEAEDESEDGAGDGETGGDWMFSRNSAVTYPDLPLVNGNNVYNKNDIRMKCNVIFKSIDIDYKHAGDSMF